MTALLQSKQTRAGVELRLTPQGRLLLYKDPLAPPLAAEISERISAAFARGTGEGLLHLGAVETGSALPAVFGWWRGFGARWVTALRALPEPGTADVDVPPPPPTELTTLAWTAPPMPGSEYLGVKVLRDAWQEITRAFNQGRAAAGTTAADYLKSLNPAWHFVGRVHFNLAENRRDDALPFAFLATYTDRLSAQGKAQHLPLGQALKQYAGERNRQRLLSLLQPVQRAADRCPWLKQLIETGELFHPLRWSPADAFRLLTDLPVLEDAGVVVRMPANWKGARPARPQATATIGGRQPSVLGTDALLDFRMDVTLDGQPLTEREIRQILAGTSGLALVRGQWIEVDRERLARMVEKFRKADQLAGQKGLTFIEAMRLLAGADIHTAQADQEDRQWSQAVAGPWLSETLRALRSPQVGGVPSRPRGLHGDLRPYQQTGVSWLRLLSGLGLGACLADDMGLGKTIQVISLLLLARGGKQPSLLVVPASLMANWVSELDRFAPSLRYSVAHASYMPADELKEFDPVARELDVVITSYGSLLRLPRLARADWNLAVLDEAQAIKNPAAKQTRAVKALKSRARIALTGTPVENRLGDLWSIFDFINPGLLGSARQFGDYAKQIANGPAGSFGPLRELVRPYILRRLKTDKSVISDLPEKTEVTTWCSLAPRQAALYREAVQELATALKTLDGMERRGIVLAFLTRFKQLCNHPSQWLGDGAWAEHDSGKFTRLRELCETIAAKQEKVLVFTQFRETTGPLEAYLGNLFGATGLVLHGNTPVKQRREMVQRFQNDESIPFFILSLKAGGSGLNLTAASHVIHFDRWWNPAVENQATDRAFRIGQKRNVLVHKFVCRGTVEQKIDELIESKKKLTSELLEGGQELNLTELSDSELIRLVSLDLTAAIKD
ncbi:MAG: DEAD/DEAH box helicase [Planctomycetes bacterium]|nr:DEAD/DEAH box helicase [Planctomycetota bacterium]MCL4729915.1 DEAD/DEAH box helicase [Planctomycetota bacterium]